MTWKTKITMKRIYLTTQFMMAQSTWTQFWKPLRFVQKAITSMLMHGSYPDLVRFKIIQEMWFSRCQVKMILCLGLRDTQGLLWRLGSVSKWALWSTGTTTTQVFFKICSTKKIMRKSSHKFIKNDSCWTRIRSEPNYLNTTSVPYECFFINLLVKHHKRKIINKLLIFSFVTNAYK